MKRMTILFTLIAVLLGILPTQVGAAGDSYAYSDTNITIITPATFQQMFSASAVDVIHYDYTMNVVDDTLSKALVSVQMELTIANTQHHITTQGYVNSYQLPSGEVFWEGPTEGVLTIEDREYIVIAALSKLASSDTPMIVISIQGDDIPVVGFYFGDNQITDEVHQIVSQQGQPNITEGEISQIEEVFPEDNSDVAVTFGIRDDIVQEENFDGGTMNLGPNYEWDYKGSCYTGFANSGASGFALRSYAYFWPEGNRLAITTKSYCSNVSSYYESIPSYSVYHTSISELSVTLDLGEVNNTNVANIIGMVKHDFEETDFAKAGRALKPLFEELMTKWDYGSAIVSALLDTLVGRVDTSLSEGGFVDYAWIDISFGLFEYANFDESCEGVPLVFSLAPAAQSSYVGATPFTATTSMTYRTYMYEQTSGMKFYMYTSAEDAVMNLTLDLG